MAVSDSSSDDESLATSDKYYRYQVGEKIDAYWGGVWCPLPPHSNKCTHIHQTHPTHQVTRQPAPGGSMR